MGCTARTYSTPARNFNNIHSHLRVAQCACPLAAATPCLAHARVVPFVAECVHARCPAALCARPLPLVAGAAVRRCVVCHRRACTRQCPRTDSEHDGPSAGNRPHRGLPGARHQYRHQVAADAARDAAIANGIHPPAHRRLQPHHHRRGVAADARRHRAVLRQQPHAVRCARICDQQLHVRWRADQLHHRRGRQFDPQRHLDLRAYRSGARRQWPGDRLG